MAKILIADDDRDIRELCIFSLRFAGYEVLGASNGEEALVQAKHNLPDLIIMDVRMPIMNGYEVCKVIKADHTTSSIPIIFLSARGQESEVQAGIHLGAVDYIHKPITPDQLIEKVRKHLLKTQK